MSFLFSPICCCGSDCYICYDKFDRPNSTGLVDISTGSCRGYDFGGDSSKFSIVNSSLMIASGAECILIPQKQTRSIISTVMIEQMSGMSSGAEIKLYVDYSGNTYAKFNYASSSTVAISLYHNNVLLTESPLLSLPSESYLAGSTTVNTSGSIWAGVFQVFSNSNSGSLQHWHDTLGYPSGYFETYGPTPCTGIGDDWKKCWYDNGKMFMAGIGAFPTRHYKITNTPSDLSLPDPGDYVASRTIGDYSFGMTNNPDRIVLSYNINYLSNSGHQTALSFNHSGVDPIAIGGLQGLGGTPSQLTTFGGIGLWNNSLPADSGRGYLPDYSGTADGLSIALMGKPLCIAGREDCMSHVSPYVFYPWKNYLGYNFKTRAGSWEESYVADDPTNTTYRRVTSTSPDSILEITTAYKWARPEVTVCNIITNLYQSGVNTSARVDVGYNEIGEPYYYVVVNFLGTTGVYANYVRNLENLYRLNLLGISTPLSPLYGKDGIISLYNSSDVLLDRQVFSTDGDTADYFTGKFRLNIGYSNGVIRVMAGNMPYGMYYSYPGSIGDYDKFETNYHWSYATTVPPRYPDAEEDAASLRMMGRIHYTVDGGQLSSNVTIPTTLGKYTTRYHASVTGVSFDNHHIKHLTKNPNPEAYTIYNSGSIYKIQDDIQSTCGRTYGLCCCGNLPSEMILTIAGTETSAIPSVLGCKADGSGPYTIEAQPGCTLLNGEFSLPRYSGDYWPSGYGVIFEPTLNEYRCDFMLHSTSTVVKKDELYPVYTGNGVVYTMRIATSGMGVPDDVKYLGGTPPSPEVESFNGAGYGGAIGATGADYFASTQYLLVVYIYQCSTCNEYFSSRQSSQTIYTGLIPTGVSCASAFPIVCNLMETGVIYCSGAYNPVCSFPQTVMVSL